jgi:hypothetical protein
MRAMALAALAGLALVSAVGPSGGESSRDTRMAEFVRKTCTAGLQEPANVERIAAAGGWPRFADRASPQADFMTVIGTWRATLGDDTVLVSIGTSESGGRPQTLCTVVFEDAKPRRAAFLPVVAAGWTLDTIMDSSARLRHEMYAVRNASAIDLVLQMDTDEGLVVSVTLLGTR